MRRFPISRLHALVSLAPLAASVTMTTADAAQCKFVRGTLEETAVTGPGCTSPVGLCTVARMFGSLKGEGRFTATDIIASADTPTTGVVFVTGDSTIVQHETRRAREAMAPVSLAQVVDGEEGVIVG